MTGNDSRRLDDPGRIDELRQRIQAKGALRRWYEEGYERFEACLERCPPDGVALELGSGASFAQERIPELLRSDVLPYEGVDRVVDAMDMPFESGSLRAIVMQNVFHHIPDVARFLSEARRTLAPGGRILMIEPHVGWLATPFWRHLHHEDFEPHAPSWEFASTGPVSGANGALAWMVFQRDREIFSSRFPELEVVRYRVHTPLRYFLMGGLQRWTLLPEWGFGMASACDRFLATTLPSMGSFVDVELVRRETPKTSNKRAHEGSPG